MDSKKLVKDLAVKNQAGKSALYGKIVNGKVVYHEKTSPPIYDSPAEPEKQWGKASRQVKKTPLKRFIEVLFG